jgi:RAP1 GTPase activating protein 1
LDTQFGQTGEYTFYTDHQGKEVMFHIATLLPFSETDTQQLQRKRHIGNDIVSIVFQEGSTPFTPDMVTSHFLHTYIVVQPMEGDRYRVSVTAREDVPYFGPSLPSPAVFRRGSEFREWLLCKLINAETASYKAEKFSKLEQRTRTSLLSNLVEELTSKTSDFLGIPPAESSLKNEKAEESGGIFKSVKKAFASRTKSSALNDLTGSKIIPKSKSSNTGFSSSSLNPEMEEGGRRGLLAPGRRGTKSDSGRGSVGTGSVTSSTGRGSSPISSSSSPDLTARMGPTMHSESDTSSLNSIEYEQNSRISPKKRVSLSAGMDRGVALDPACQEIVSGAVTMVTLEGNAVAGQLSKLQDEVSKLKVDKLELLRQNVAAQREVKR